MTNEELKRIMYEDPERYQYIMRTAHSGRTGRIDRVYDPELDAAEPEQDYLSPSKAASQMAGYRPTLGREAVYNEASNDPYTTYMNSTYVSDTANDTVDNTAKIAQLEQQIAQVKERIARNKRALSGKSYEDVNNQIAALEMKKINSQDPSMIWRWQQQRQDTKNANDVVKKNTANKFVNEVEALTKTSISPDYAEQVQQLRNVRNKIAEGKTLGYDVSGLEEMEKAIQAKVDKTYGNIEAVKTIRNKLKNLDQQLADKTITPEQYTAEVNMLKGADFDDDELRNELNTKSMLGSKKGADAAKAAAKKKSRKSIFGD